MTHRHLEQMSPAWDRVYQQIDRLEATIEYQRVMFRGVCLIALVELACLVMMWGRVVGWW